MIEAFFYKGDSGHYTGFEVRGHSDFLKRKKREGISHSGGKGQKNDTSRFDLVCAAVSILIYTAAYSLENVVGAKVKVNIGKGYQPKGCEPEGYEPESSLFQCNIADRYISDRTDTVMETVISGLKLLKEKYKDDIFLEVKKS